LKAQADDIVTWETARGRASTVATVRQRRERPSGAATATQSAGTCAIQFRPTTPPPQFVVAGNAGDQINYCCRNHPTERDRSSSLPVNSAPVSLIPLGVKYGPLITSDPRLVARQSGTHKPFASTLSPGSSVAHPFTLLRSLSTAPPVDLAKQSCRRSSLPTVCCADWFPVDHRRFQLEPKRHRRAFRNCFVFTRP